MSQTDKETEQEIVNALETEATNRVNAVTKLIDKSAQSRAASDAKEYAEAALMVAQASSQSLQILLDVAQIAKTK